MRRTILAFTALTAALVSTSAQAETVVLKPSSPWNVDFGVDKCRLVRLFGEGEDSHFLAFQQYSPAREAGLTVAGPAFKKFRSLDRTQVRFFAAQEPFVSTPFTGTVDGFGTGVIFSTIRLDEGMPDTAEPPDAAPTGISQMNPAFGQQVQFLELRQGSREVRLETGPLGDAFKVLNQCTLDLLRDWGLDPERHLTAINRPRWLNQDALVRRIMANYPREAWSQGEQGIMRMRVIVSAEGNVESCTILKATDTDRLESPACGMMKAAKFEPARDAGGQPFRSFYATSITYRGG
ncbi:MAG: hypothetical protein C0517_04180 [Erythrobacter sp.]|nr:hypothetical protein [Erythrobacter sp.]